MSLKIKLFLVFEFLLQPFTYISSLWLRQIRKIGVKNCKYSKKIFLKLGFLPITNHYYEPFFTPDEYIEKPRNLTGIDWNINEQLHLLKEFNYNDELLEIPIDKNEDLKFYYNNLAFGSGDAEFLYNIIRLKKPNKILEIGSGSSTLMALNAILKNKEENPDYFCEQICIEPYEHKWLEKLPVKIFREKAESLDKKLFSELKQNDILFIDSSHVIRPQGDVVFEFLELLPILNSGVIIHIHDIFTPNDYPKFWVFDCIRLFSEQYLLEAFLTNNTNYKVIGALNYLKNNYPKELYEVCPVLKMQSDRDPGSFWIQKREINN